MSQTALMLIDSFAPEGVTTLAKDSIFMMPHLGVLAQVHPQAALEVFEKDCLIYLGTCVAAKGTGKAGKPCFSYTLKSSGTERSGEILCDDIELLPLADGTAGRIELTPARGFDLGAGSGKSLECEVKGGTVGLILDGRGRPLALPEDRTACRQTAERWIKALGLYT